MTPRPSVRGMIELEREFTVTEVAEALGLSDRWVRNGVARGAEHQRYGNRIRFTPQQLERLRARHRREEFTPPPPPITTGPRKHWR
jgi:Helix-turn-helix domain